MAVPLQPLANPPIGDPMFAEDIDPKTHQPKSWTRPLLISWQHWFSDVVAAFNTLRAQLQTAIANLATLTTTVNSSALTTSATIANTFLQINGQTHSDFNLIVIGAIVGNPVMIGANPPAPDGTVFEGLILNVGVVTIRFKNLSIAPKASGLTTFKIVTPLF